MLSQSPAEVLSNLRLVALPTSVRHARQFTEVTLEQWLLQDLSDTACLLVSELATNAVRSTGTLSQPATLEEVATIPTIRLQLKGNIYGLLIEMWDCAADTAPSVQPHSLESLSGRGLHLVAAMSSSWGTYLSMRGGKVVWCQLQRPPASIPASSVAFASASFPRSPLTLRFLNARFLAVKTFQ